MTHFHIDHHGDLPSSRLRLECGFFPRDPRRSTIIWTAGDIGVARPFGGAAYGAWLTAPGFPLTIREIAPDGAI